MAFSTRLPHSNLFVWLYFVVLLAFMLISKSRGTSSTSRMSKLASPFIYELIPRNALSYNPGGPRHDDDAALLDYQSRGSTSLLIPRVPVSTATLYLSLPLTLPSPASSSFVYFVGLLRERCYRRYMPYNISEFSCNTSHSLILKYLQIRPNHLRHFYDDRTIFSFLL